MLLTHETTIVLNKNDANIVGHMCYAAYKLWNVCNYERNNYKNLGLEKYPDWYYQKSRHKDDLWFKSLPSQTAQEGNLQAFGQVMEIFLPVKRKWRYRESGNTKI